MLRQAVGLLTVLAFFTLGEASFSQMQAPVSAITGNVTYRQRMALPPDAVIDVTLEDVSLVDAPAKVLVLQIFSTEGRQVPIPFQLKYDPAQILPGHRYQVRAKIVSAGQTIFTTTTAYPVITDGAPTDVTLMLEQVTPPPETASDPEASPAIQSQPAPNQPEAGHAAPAETVQSEPDASQPTPDSVARASRSSVANVTLDGTYWKLVVLDGKPALDGFAGTEANLLLHAQGKKLAGSGGCNRIVGNYESAGETIHFNPAGTSMMMCPPPLMKQEQAFLGALKSATSYRIQLQTLELMDGQGVLAVFRAKYLK